VEDAAAPNQEEGGDGEVARPERQGAGRDQGAGAPRMAVAPTEAARTRRQVARLRPRPNRAAASPESAPVVPARPTRHHMIGPQAPRAPTAARGPPRRCSRRRPSCRRGTPALAGETTRSAGTVKGLPCPRRQRPPFRGRARPAGASRSRGPRGRRPRRTRPRRSANPGRCRRAPCGNQEDDRAGGRQPEGGPGAHHR
jgi:hypothetical protein